MILDGPGLSRPKTAAIISSLIFYSFNNVFMLSVPGHARKALTGSGCPEDPTKKHDVASVAPKASKSDPASLVGCSSELCLSSPLTVRIHCSDEAPSLVSSYS